jgi:hypothetical protein
MLQALSALNPKSKFWNDGLPLEIFEEAASKVLGNIRQIERENSHMEDFLERYIQAKDFVPEHHHVLHREYVIKISLNKDFLSKLKNFHENLRERSSKT